MSKNLDSKNQKNSLVFETLNDVSTMQVTESKDAKGNTLMSLTGTFGVCGVLNNNNRIYETSNYKAMVDVLKKEIAEKGGIPGELEHPNTMNITLDNVSHKITDINIDENGLVTGTIVLLDTPKGQLAQSIVRGGLPLYVSSRATGEIKESKVCLSKIYTYDLVGTPGFSQARVHLNENQSVTQLNESVYVISEGGASKNNDTNTQKRDMYHKTILEGRFVDGWYDPIDKKLGTLKYEENPELTKEFNDANNDDEFFVNKKYQPQNVTIYSTKYQGKVCANVVIDANNGDKKFLFDLGNFLTASYVGIDHFYFTTSNPGQRISLEILNVELDSNEDGSLYFADRNIDLSFENPNHEEWVEDGMVDPWPDDDYNENNNNNMTEQINEAVLASENRTQDYIINTVMPTIEDWMVESFAPEIQKWLESHYKQSIQEATEDYISKSVAPVIEDWVCNEYSKSMENWLNTEYASKIESWITEQFAGILDGYIGEQLTPEILNQAKIQLNESLKENKKNTLVDIKDTLTMLEGIAKTNVNGTVGNFKPAGTINESLNKFNDQPVYIKNMPDHIRPKYLSLNESIKESIDTRAKLFNFNVPGAIERFWADFDERYGKQTHTNVNESGATNNGNGQFNGGLILDNRERAIRETLRARFANRLNR